MSLLSALRCQRPTSLPASLRPCFAVRPCRSISSTAPLLAESSKSEKSAPGSAGGPKVPLSSCTEGTVLEGVAWLKGQPPVTALADEEYPSWLWKLLEPKVIPNDGPGGKGEKIRLRKENRKKIRDTQFMKTQ